MVKENKPVKNPKFYNIEFLEKRLEKIEEKEDRIRDNRYSLGKRVYELSMVKPKMKTPFLEAALQHGREELQIGDETLNELKKEKKHIKRVIKNKKDKQKKV